jgi:signal transduction histidine kinase
MKAILEKQKVEYLFENLLTSLLAVTVLLSIVYYLYTDHVEALTLNIWYGVGIGIMALRALSVRYYRTNFSYTNIQIHKQMFVILTILTALHLGSGAFFVFPYTLDYQIVLLFFIGGLVAGASVTLATYKTLYLFYLVISIVPYTIVLFLKGGEANYALILSMVLYILFLAINAGRIATSVINNIQLQNKNDMLIEKLEAEVQLSNNANEAKSKFLSVMSHELRTPLNAIIMKQSIKKQALILKR